MTRAPKARIIDAHSIGGRGDAFNETKTAVLLLTCLLGLAAASSAFAGQPPGQLGYEGQPETRVGGGGHHAPGLLGYEGQPETRAANGLLPGLWVAGPVPGCLHNSG